MEAYISRSSKAPTEHYFFFISLPLLFHELLSGGWAGRVGGGALRDRAAVCSLKNKKIKSDKPEEHCHETNDEVTTQATGTVSMSNKTKNIVPQQNKF